MKKADDINVCLVTGGAGFLGRNIIRALLGRGCHVKSFDLVPLDLEHEKLEVLEGDISVFSDIEKACQGVDTVFHTAAIICLLGGRAVTDAYRQRAIRVNVTGTENLIKACKSQGVKRLVHTSTNNVVFNGEALPDADQRTPYATKVYDMYTETKIAAEKAVLAANGVDGLLSCAIRPGGIYGPEHNIVVDATVCDAVSGKLAVLIGSASAIHDNTYIDNLVHAQLLAAEALVEGNNACGKAYFITDDEPRNNFEFFRPFVEKMGYRYPNIRIPYQPVRFAMVVWEWLHFKFGIPAPVAAPKEIEKVGVTQFSNIKDAARDLGYSPVVSLDEAVDRCIPHLREVLKRNGL